MLLERLCQYAGRLEDLAPAMYIKTPIRWLIDLTSSGKVKGFVQTEGTGKKNDRGKEFYAPHVGRSSGVRAKLLADNGEYVLGIAREKSKPERVRQCHEAFVEEVRNWVDATRGSEPRYKIFVENRGYLVDHKKRAYEVVGGKKGDDSKADAARQWMCQNYFDVRMFGAVLVGKKGEGYNCGQVRGPVQLTFARSIDPVVPLDLSITRVALENPGDKPREDEDEKASTGTMGRKALLPYGLYRGYGFFTPHFAQQTGVTSDDLALFWEALQQMWTIDRSSARGMMALRGLHVFSHDTSVGKAPAQSLFELVKVRVNDDVKAPRAFTDYCVTVNEKGVPNGVEFTRLVG